MSIISSKIIKKAVYKLCFDAGVHLNPEIYKKIYTAYNNSGGEEKEVLKTILQNAKTAAETKYPLCQDTGQVIVFAKIGQNVKIEGEYIEKSINKGVSDCYKDNFFRKSVVKNAVFDRRNTKDNTPCIIYTQITEGDEIKLAVMLKGAGSENKSRLEMMLPTSSEEEIIKKCSEMAAEAGENSCPPMFIGIGIGATADKAFVASKEVFVCDDFSKNDKIIAEKIKDKVNSLSTGVIKNNYVIDVKLKTMPTHIACLPVAVTVNCHSDRYSKCVINENGIKYEHDKTNFYPLETDEINYPEIKTDDVESIKKLKTGEKVFLSGEILVARDAAHKRISDIINSGKKLPFELKNKIIFYAGPCPCPPGKITGSIGPTTASRMDKYTDVMCDSGIIAAIGKGSRSDETKQKYIKNGIRYFTVTGGIAALLAEKIKKSEIIAFEDLGAEAVYRLVTEKFPVKTVI